MKLLFFLLLPILILSEKPLRDTIRIKTDLFEITYSEKLQQPKFIKYNVQCPNGTASRKGMDFYLCDSIVTSDDNDYENNIYDKGHLAPAADFSCTKEMMYKTFTYLNCSLQHEKLNRVTWKSLESRERSLAKTHPVSVEIKCVFSNKSIRLISGATVPDAYYKTIKYNNTVERYYFKNEKPIYNDYNKYRIK